MTTLPTETTLGGAGDDNVMHRLAPDMARLVGAVAAGIDRFGSRLRNAGLWPRV